ncbi:16173_t:CDS:2, partial [Dentiscutata erythropus]
ENAADNPNGLYANPDNFQNAYGVTGQKILIAGPNNNNGN